MYTRGIIHIVMIIIGLVIIAVLIGMFSHSSRTIKVQTETVEYTTN